MFIFLNQWIDVILKLPDFCELWIKSLLQILLVWIHRIILFFILRFTLMMSMIFSLCRYHLQWKTTFTTIIIKFSLFSKYNSWWIILIMFDFILILLSESSTWAHSILKFSLEFFLVFMNDLCLSELTYLDRTLIFRIFNFLHVVFANEWFYLIDLKLERNSFLLLNRWPVVVIERLGFFWLFSNSETSWILLLTLLNLL